VCVSVCYFARDYFIGKDVISRILIKVNLIKGGIGGVGIMLRRRVTEEERNVEKSFNGGLMCRDDDDE